MKVMHGDLQMLHPDTKLKQLL